MRYLMRGGSLAQMASHRQARVEFSAVVAAAVTYEVRMEGVFNDNLRSVCRPFTRLESSP